MSEAEFITGGQLWLIIGITLILLAISIKRPK